MRISLVVQWIRICQCRGHRLNPWSGKIPHVAEQLSPHSRLQELQVVIQHAATTEAHASRVCAPQQEKPLPWEAHAPQWRVAPLSATRENPRAAMKTGTTKTKYIFFKKERNSKPPKTTQLGNAKIWKFSNLGIFALKATADLLPPDTPKALSCLALNHLVWR